MCTLEPLPATSGDDQVAALGDQGLRNGKADVCDLPVLRASLPLNLEFSLPASTMSPQQGAIVAAKSERARQYRAEMKIHPKHYAPTNLP